MQVSHSLKYWEKDMRAARAGYIVLMAIVLLYMAWWSFDAKLHDQHDVGDTRSALMMYALLAFGGVYYVCFKLLPDYLARRKQRTRR